MMELAGGVANMGAGGCAVKAYSFIIISLFSAVYLKVNSKYFNIHSALELCYV